MAVNLSPVGGAAAQFFDNSGNVLTGGKLYTYAAGTTTPAVTYTTNSGLTAHSNPIVLNAAGRVPDSGEIWLSDSVLYKFVLKDTNDVQIAVWDNISGINSNFIAYATQNESVVATQGQTLVTFPGIQYTPATDNLSVFVNGSKQILGLNYTETSSSSITFIDGLNVGDVVEATTASPVATNVVDAANVSYLPGGVGAVQTNVQAKLREVIAVEDFGAVGDGVTDDTLAFQDAATYIQSLGGATLSLGNGKTYLVYPTGISHTVTLLDFTNCNGVAIEGNGATIKTGADTTTRNIVYLNAAFNVTIRNVNFESTLQTLSSNTGVFWIVANYGAKNIALENLDFQYGCGGLAVRGIYSGQGTDADRARNINANNLSFFSCYYPLNFQSAGDNFFARNIYTRNCGRSYFPYNVRNHDVYLDSRQGGPFSDVLLKVYTDPSFSYNRLENIKLNYYSEGRYAGAGNQGVEEAMVAIDLQQNTATSTAAFVQNIDIKFNVEPSPSAKNQSLFIIRKYTSAGAPDPTGRGHQVVNLNLSGVGRSLQNLLSDYIILFNRSGENWAGDNAYNVTVTDFILGGSNTQDAIVINGAPISSTFGQCLVSNVSSDATLNRVGTNATVFGVVNSKFSNYFCATECPQSFIPSWTGTVSNPSIGNGTLIGYYTLENKLCTVEMELTVGSTTTFGSGNWAFSVPFSPSADVSNSIGSAIALNFGVNFYTGTTIMAPNSAAITAYLGGITPNSVNPTNPWTWKTGDTLKMQITYPIAP